MSTFQAYGAGMVGGEFNVIQFVKRPSVILRVVCGVFSLIIGLCVHSSWYSLRTSKAGATEEICLFNQSAGTCSIGELFAFLALIIAIAFIVVDYMFDRISSVNNRRKVVLADIGTSGTCAVVYLLLFFTFVTKMGVDREDVVDYNGFSLKCAVAFSLFSIASWAGLTWLAWRRLQEGSTSAFAPSTYEDNFASVPPHGYDPSRIGGGLESYQEPPFTAKAAGGGYDQ